MEEVERWADIAGYEGLYMVSTWGRVKSLERKVWDNRGYYKTVPERILKPSKVGDGYLRLFLCKDGKKEGYKVHRLVCKAFISNPQNLPCINHKDEDKLNNHKDNLEWCSYSYNNSYNGKGKKIGEKLRNDLKRCKAVIGIDCTTGLILKFPSAREVERTLGINNSSIIQCCKGRKRYKTAGGFYWYYANDYTE